MSLLNKYLASNELKDQFFNIDPEIMKACEIEAIDMASKHFSDIDLSTKENSDLVIKPLASVIAMYEIMLQNIFASSSIHTLVDSTTTPEYIKSNLMKSFALSSGIETFGNDSRTIYNQIVFFIKNTDTNSQYGLSNKLFSEAESISRLFFADNQTAEMSRNKISPIRLNSSEQMNFLASDMNPATLLDGAYSRSDMQRYIEFNETKKIVLSGMLDVYFDSGVIRETVSVTRGIDGRYSLPENYYIYAMSDKNLVLISNDNRKNGIVKSEMSIFIEDGLESENIDIMYYLDAEIDTKDNKDSIVSSDILFKGFYPLIANPIIRTRKSLVVQDKENITTIIKDYVYEKKGRLENLSVFELQDKLRVSGYDVVVSSSFSAYIYTSTNMNIPQTITFPITMKDIDIPNELMNSSISENTICLKIGEVLFEAE